MTSGALFAVYPEVSTKLNNPPPAPGALMKVFVFVDRTVGVVVPFASTLLHVLKPRPPMVACGPSTDRASANFPPKSFTTRKPYCRAHVKPTLYCGSIVSGKASSRLLLPLRFSVANDHICPPVNAHPLSSATRAHACRSRST